MNNDSSLDRELDTLFGDEDEDEAEEEEEEEIIEDKQQQCSGIPIDHMNPETLVSLIQKQILEIEAKDKLVKQLWEAAQRERLQRVENEKQVLEYKEQATTYKEAGEQLKSSYFELKNNYEKSEQELNSNRMYVKQLEYKLSNLKDASDMKHQIEGDKKKICQLKDRNQILKTENSNLSAKLKRKEDTIQRLNVKLIEAERLVNTVKSLGCIFPIIEKDYEGDIFSPLHLPPSPPLSITQNQVTRSDFDSDSVCSSIYSISSKLSVEQQQVPKEIIQEDDSNTKINKTHDNKKQSNVRTPLIRNIPKKKSKVNNILINTEKSIEEEASLIEMLLQENDNTINNNDLNNEPKIINNFESNSKSFIPNYVKISNLNDKTTIHTTTTTTTNNMKKSSNLEVSEISSSSSSSTSSTSSDSSSESDNDNDLSSFSSNETSLSPNNNNNNNKNNNDQLIKREMLFSRKVHPRKTKSSNNKNKTNTNKELQTTREKIRSNSLDIIAINSGEKLCDKKRIENNLKRKPVFNSIQNHVSSIIDGKNGEKKIRIDDRVEQNHTNHQTSSSSFSIHPSSEKRNSNTIKSSTVNLPTLSQSFNIEEKCINSPSIDNNNEKLKLCNFGEVSKKFMKGKSNKKSKLQNLKQETLTSDDDDEDENHQEITTETIKYESKPILNSCSFQKSLNNKKQQTLSSDDEEEDGQETQEKITISKEQSVSTSPCPSTTTACITENIEPTSLKVPLIINKEVTDIGKDSEKCIQVQNPSPLINNVEPVQEKARDKILKSFSDIVRVGSVEEKMCNKKILENLIKEKSKNNSDKKNVESSLVDTTTMTITAANNKNMNNEVKQRQLHRTSTFVKTINPDKISQPPTILSIGTKSFSSFSNDNDILKSLPSSPYDWTKIDIKKRFKKVVKKHTPSNITTSHPSSKRSIPKAPIMSLHDDFQMSSDDSSSNEENIDEKEIVHHEKISEKVNDSSTSKKRNNNKTSTLISTKKFDIGSKAKSQASNKSILPLSTLLEEKEEEEEDKITDGLSHGNTTTVNLLEIVNEKSQTGKSESLVQSLPSPILTSSSSPPHSKLDTTVQPEIQTNFEPVQEKARDKILKSFSDIVRVGSVEEKMCNKKILENLIKEKSKNNLDKKNVEPPLVDTGITIALANNKTMNNEIKQKQLHRTTTIKKDKISQPPTTLSTALVSSALNDNDMLKSLPSSPYDWTKIDIKKRFKKVVKKHTPSNITTSHPSSKRSIPKAPCIINLHDDLQISEDDSSSSSSNEKNIHEKEIVHHEKISEKVNDSVNSNKKNNNMISTKKSYAIGSKTKSQASSLSISPLSTLLEEDKTIDGLSHGNTFTVNLTQASSEIPSSTKTLDMTVQSEIQNNLMPQQNARDKIRSNLEILQIGSGESMCEKKKIEMRQKEKKLTSKQQENSEEEIQNRNIKVIGEIPSCPIPKLQKSFVGPMQGQKSKVLDVDPCKSKSVSNCMTKLDLKNKTKEINSCKFKQQQTLAPNYASTDSPAEPSVIEECNTLNKFTSMTVGEINEAPKKCVELLQYILSLPGYEEIRTPQVEGYIRILVENNRGLPVIPPEYFARSIYQEIYNTFQTRLHRTSVKSWCQNIAHLIIELKSLYPREYIALDNAIISYFLKDVIENLYHKFNDDRIFHRLGNYYGIICWEFKNREFSRRILLSIAKHRQSQMLSFACGFLKSCPFFWKFDSFSCFGFVDKALLYLLSDPPKYYDSKYYVQVKKIILQGFRITVPTQTPPRFFMDMWNYFKCFEILSAINEGEQVLELLLLQCDWEQVLQCVQNTFQNALKEWEKGQLLDVTFAAFLRIIVSACEETKHVNPGIIASTKAFTPIKEILNIVNKLDKSSMSDNLKTVISSGLAKIEELIKKGLRGHIILKYSTWKDGQKRKLLKKRKLAGPSKKHQKKKMQNLRRNEKKKLRLHEEESDVLQIKRLKLSAAEVIDNTPNDIFKQEAIKLNSTNDYSKKFTCLDKS